MTPFRNYPLLLVSQFLGAFGDNAVLTVMLGALLRGLSDGTIDGREQQYLNILYTSLLFVPYVLLAPLAGWFNDRYPKTFGLRGGNLLKLAGGTLMAVAAWRVGGHPSTAWMIAGYLVVGAGSCLYSPAKYGILPEILPPGRLVRANGLVEVLTLVAILAGNIVGAVLVDRLAPPVAYTVVAALFGGSLCLNLFMTRGPADPSVRWQDSLGEFHANLRGLVASPRLVRMLAGTALFWICGALLKMNFQPWGQQVLGLDSMTRIALLGLWLSVGVMAGSLLAGRLYAVGDLHHTRRHAFALAAGIAALGAVGPLIHAGLSRPQPMVIGLLVGAGVFAGLFLIPLNAGLQSESHRGRLGKTIATQNLMENAAMLGGSAFAAINVTARLGPSQLFLSLAVLVALAACFLHIPPRRTV